MCSDAVTSHNKLGTNLLFFEKEGKTKEIWFYDFVGYSEDILKKNYTKANPVNDEDLNDCYEKWKKKEISEYSWIVQAKELEKNYDLTAKNPNKKEDYKHTSPEILLSGIIEKERRISQILDDLRKALDEGER